MVEPLVERAISELGSVHEAAKKLGVSRALLYKILSGDRDPSDKLLSKLGLMRVEFIRPAFNGDAVAGKSR